MNILNQENWEHLNSNFYVNIWHSFTYKPISFINLFISLIELKTLNLFFFLTYLFLLLN